MTVRPLTKRDIDTLGELDAAVRNFLEYDIRNGFVRPLDCGGSNGSHHSPTLKKLAARGLVLRRKAWGGAHEKGSCSYRITEEGKKLLRDRGYRVPDYKLPEGNTPL